MYTVQSRYKNPDKYITRLKRDLWLERRPARHRDCEIRAARRSLHQIAQVRFMGEENRFYSPDARLAYNVAISKAHRLAQFGLGKISRAYSKRKECEVE